MQLLEAIERPSAYGQTPAVVLIGTNSESFGSKLHTTIKSSKFNGVQEIVSRFYFLNCLHTTYTLSSPQNSLHT